MAMKSRHSPFTGELIYYDEERYLRAHPPPPKTTEERLANIEQMLAQLLGGKADGGGKPVEVAFDIEYGWNGKPTALIAREVTGQST